MRESVFRGVIIVTMTAMMLALSQTVNSSEESQKEENTPSRVERFLASQSDDGENTSSAEEADDATSTAFFPEFSAIALEDPETKTAMFSALQSYYDYRTRGFEHRKEVFAWQLFSAKIIFGVVIFLVLVGVYFSWVQFHKKMVEPSGNSVSDTTAGTTPSGDAAEVTTISASAKEIKVSSPVLGVIILVISLLFFYLYLIYVFPIEEIL